ncbi:MAG: hypothetical protein AAF657_18475 [Acidobacteriota bacterium]
MNPSRRIVFLLSIAFAVVGLTLSAQPMAPPESTPILGQGDGGPCQGEHCVVPDDGTAETGYGWVPSVVEGEFVQRIHSGQFPTRNLDSLCICWIRSQTDDTIDFEIVFYDEVDGVPGPLPYAVVPASAVVPPVGITETFAEVDLGVTIPVGPSYIGARWDASADRFFFVCTDTSDATEPVDVFFRDDRTKNGIWTSVFVSNDPIFDAHRSMMIRACSNLLTAVDIPTLGVGGLLALVLLLAGFGLRKLSPRRAGRKSWNSRS